MNKNINKKVKTGEISVLIQTVLAIATISFAVMTLYIVELIPLMEFFLALLMFVMAYNNKTIIKRKYLTVIYIIVGALALLSAIIGMIL